MVVDHAAIFGIGIGEMLFIAAIALVVIGPERFPEFARVVMRTIRDVRGYVDEAKQELDKELRPIKKEMRQLEQYEPKRYFDDITKKALDPTPPKGAQEYGKTSENSEDAVEPEPNAAPSADFGEEGASEASVRFRAPEGQSADGGEPAPEPEKPAYAPKSEMDYDHEATPFPPSEPRADEDEPYRD